MLNLTNHFNREVQKKLEDEFLFWFILFLLILLEKRKARLEQQLRDQLRFGPR